MKNNMNNDPFKAHNVEYLSPSALNTFAASPAKWLTKVAGYKDQMYKPPFTYGNAVELGITQALMHDAPVAECIDVAMAEFDRVWTVRKAIMTTITMLALKNKLGALTFLLK